jgi:hypothetical protein
MKTSFRVILLVMVFFVCAAFGGTLDQRFNGMWSGIESIQGYFVRNQLGGGQTPGRVSALIGITDSGKTFAVVQGLTPGRYDVSPDSNGNTLKFDLHEMHPKGSHGLFYGRTQGKLVLSADGNTLTETSYAVLPGTGRPVDCVISGTFHRQPRK